MVTYDERRGVVRIQISLYHGMTLTRDQASELAAELADLFPDICRCRHVIDEHNDTGETIKHLCFVDGCACPGWRNRTRTTANASA
jgi:hypothetical protein